MDETQLVFLKKSRNIYNLEKSEIENRLQYLKEKIKELDIKINNYIAN
jgi:hypothetical protein